MFCNGTPNTSADASESAAAKQRFSDAYRDIRTLVNARAEKAEEAADSAKRAAIGATNQIYYGGRNTLLSAQASLRIAAYESEVQRAQALYDERMSKVRENRDDALRRLDEVAHAFAANKHPADALETAIEQSKQIYATPKNSFAFMIYDDCDDGSDIPPTPFPRHCG